MSRPSTQRPNADSAAGAAVRREGGGEWMAARLSAGAVAGVGVKGSVGRAMVETRMDAGIAGAPTTGGWQREG